MVDPVGEAAHSEDAFAKRGDVIVFARATDLREVFSQYCEVVLNVGLDVVVCNQAVLVHRG